MHDFHDTSSNNGEGGSSTPVFPSPLPHTLSHRSDSTFTDSQSSTSTYTYTNGLRHDTSCFVESTMTPYAFPVAEAVARRRPILVEHCSELVKGFELRSWDELPTRALVIPIKDLEETEDEKKGELKSQMVLIVGLNARRPFDDEYRVRCCPLCLCPERSYIRGSS
jgi:hypothetical protein